MTRGKINIGRPDLYPLAYDPNVDGLVAWPYGRAVIGIEYGGSAPVSAGAAYPGVYVQVDNADTPTTGLGVYTNSGTERARIDDQDLVLPVWHALDVNDLIGYDATDYLDQGATGLVPAVALEYNFDTEDPNTGGEGGAPIDASDGTGSLLMTAHYLYVYDGAINFADQRWQPATTIAGYEVPQLQNAYLVTSDPTDADPGVNPENPPTGQHIYGPGSLMAFIGFSGGNPVAPVWYTNTGTAAAPKWVETGIGEGGGGSGTEIRTLTPNTNAAYVSAENDGTQGYIAAYANGNGIIELVATDVGPNNPRSKIQLQSNNQPLTITSYDSSAQANAALSLNGQGDNVAELTISRADQTTVSSIHMDDDGTPARISAYDVAGEVKGVMSVAPGVVQLNASRAASGAAPFGVIELGDTAAKIHAFDADNAERVILVLEVDDNDGGAGTATLGVSRADETPVASFTLNEAGGAAVTRTFHADGTSGALLALENGGVDLEAYDTAGIQRAFAIIATDTDQGFVSIVTRRVDGTDLAAIKILTDGTSQITRYDTDGTTPLGLLQVTDQSTTVSNGSAAVDVGSGAITLAGQIKTNQTAPIGGSILDAAPSYLLDLFDENGDFLGKVPIYGGSF